MEIRDFIIDYLQREYSFPEGTDIDDLDYVETGYVDSMGMIQFIATLEDEFGITFTDDDLVDPDIKVVGKLVKMIEKKIEQERS